MARRFNVDMVLNGVDKSKGAFGSLQTSLTSVTKIVTGLAVAGVAAIGSLTAATLKAASAAGEQELVESKLAAAMQTAGQFTRDAFKANIEYANALQKVTTFGDEAIISVQTLFANYGIAAEKQNELTKATIDFAVATKMDLAAAAALVAKTIGSSTNALTRYGVGVEGAVNSSERAASAIKNLNKMFSGSAAAEANTYSGAVLQFKNVIGDLWQELGKNLLPVLTQVVQQLRDKVFVAIDFVSKNSTRLEEVFKNLALVILKLSNFFLTMVDVIFNFEKTLSKANGGTFIFLKTLDVLGNTIGGLLNSFKALGSGVAGVLKIMSGNFAGAKESFADYAESSTNAWQSFVDAFTTGNEDVLVNDAETKNEMLENHSFFLDEKNLMDEEQHVKDVERLMTFREAWFANLDAIKAKQISWITQMQKVTNAFQSSLSAGFVVLFKNIGSGWQALTMAMTAFGDMLLNSMIGILADLAANWVLQHGIMIVATKAWALASFLGAQAVAAAKVIAGWATIPFVGPALGIAAAAALVGAMNSQFKMFATGVRGFGGGMAVVGENGPELVNLPAGADVFNNQETRNMMSGGGGSSRGGMNLNINFANNTFLGTLEEISESVSDTIFEKLELNALV